MTYSFIQPRKKPIFSLFDKIWFTLFLFGIIFILSVYFMYVIKLEFISASIENKKQEALVIQEGITNANVSYEIMLAQTQIANTFNTQNAALKDSLKNLFDMIIKTDSITLETMEQDSNSLKLSGVTPTKEKFALLLETPLRSIFDESNTTYYRLNNGWYRFINISQKHSSGIK
ncbi:hypothetical protein OQH60_03140 [Campylobacter sp. MIT 21-1685]|uniref:hypothetical protein n=1 Tax=unclassified Campylobacter TaxID=2593542 RepID=UPI00224A92AB|nr:MULTISPECIES: hypothetical protein [unclassified Campylobacter]MCX2682861.1 hypothetical protein [Campylobacter sp. MIT 21-1684]MCX2751191.1 hypothetical protein [Campylobacter sp. MIT 21-1682]MCX2807342.1 hypothetical protein [Campylobacter sp. MIT 21-1685]